MAISALAKVGIGWETEWGSPAAPTVVFPIDDWSLTGPYEQILDNAKRGVLAADFGAYQGVGHAEASLEGPVFPDLFGYVLLAVFGQGSVSGTAAPYTHTFTFYGTPPSLSITEDNVVRQHQGRGMLASELSMSFNPTEGLLSYSVSFTGKQLGTVSESFPSELYLGTPMFRGWQGSIDLGGTYFPVIEGDLTISREVTLHYTLSNSQYPGTAYVGPPVVTGSFTIDYTSGADYDRYRLHQQGSVDLQFIINANKKLTITLGSVDFSEDAVELDKGEASITLAYSWRALYVSSLGGPAKAVLICDTADFGP